MTREQFDNEITTWSDLVDLARDTNNDFLVEDFYFDIDDAAENDLDHITRYENWSWREIRDALGNMPENSDVYECEGLLDYYGYDDGDERFDEVKSSLRADLEDDGYFSDDEDEDDEEEECSSSHEHCTTFVPDGVVFDGILSDFDAEPVEFEYKPTKSGGFR